jgi:hypothetical protein
MGESTTILDWHWCANFYMFWAQVRYRFDGHRRPGLRPPTGWFFVIFVPLRTAILRQGISARRGIV